MRELKMLLINRVSFDIPTSLPLQNDFIPPASDEPIVPLDDENSKKGKVPLAVQLLDSSDLDDYLKYQGVWKKALASIQNTEDKNSIIIRKNPSLSNLIDELFKLTAKPIEVYKIKPMPLVPLRIAVIGKKYAGMTIVARALAQKYDMTIFSLDDLIKDAIAVADLNPKKAKGGDKGDKKALTKQQIGAKLQLAMAEGLKPDDTLLVALLVEAMQQEPEKPGGWILVDFPRTKQQAQLLERELSGFEDPKPIKKGELKRTKDKERANTSRNRSLITGADLPEESNASPISALDAMFLLDIENSLAISRAAGQMVDSITGERYHIEFHPPPSNVPVTN
jgi:adenylate kinase family enzyme